MVAAETAAGSSYFLAARFVFCHGDDIVDDNVFIPDVCFNAVGGMDGIIVPALGIDTVRTIQFYFPRVDELYSGIDKLKILILVIPRFGGWEEDDRVPRMTDYEHFKLAIKPLRMPFSIFFFHRFT